MKDVFYFILSSIIVFALIELAKQDHDIYLQQNIHENCIVIDKYESYLRGNVMTFKTQNDSIIQHRVYDIFYNEYKVGDTVK